MTDRKTVISFLENYVNYLDGSSERQWVFVWGDVVRAALELLKAQEQEISRLKHHIDCDAAEKIPSGCVGYGRGFNDDEPCETCKECEKYNLYGVE